MSKAPLVGDSHALMGQLEQAVAEISLVVTSPSLPEDIRTANLLDIERVRSRVEGCIVQGIGQA